MNVGLVDEADVLGGAVVAGEDLHVVLLDAAGFGDDGIPSGGRDIDDRMPVEVLPFPVTEAVVVEASSWTRRFASRPSRSWMSAYS